MVETVGTAAQRVRPRRKIFQATEMRFGGTRVRVHVLDLSAGGALAHHATPPPVGTFVDIDCAGSSLRARVVRRDGARFGLQFLVPLTEAWLADAIEHDRW